MKMNIRLRNAIIVILAIAVLGGAAWGVGAYVQTKSESDGVLTASGFVETVTIDVAPELSGKVVSVSVQEGDSVRKGEEMMRLDDSLLQAQREVAAAGVDQAEAAVAAANAGVDSARIQLQAAIDASREQERAFRTAHWTQGGPEGYTLPMWYFDSKERRAALEAELAKAEADLDQAKRDLATVEQQAGNQEFLTAEKNLAQALEAYQVAAEVLDRANHSTDGAMLMEEAQREYDRAKADLEAAQVAYDRALLTDGAQNVLRARARVEVEQERCDTIQDRLRMLETGEDSPQVAAARNLLAQAQAAADQAQAALRGARANLNLIDAEISKTVVTAPVDGVVLTRASEPGSVVGAGSVVFTLGQLDRLTITVYVPEPRMGEVTLGMTATVMVDAFPGESFQAKVTYISDVAEFTPRNVQTVEGRKATVFAVTLTVTDGGGTLKPGMPADVTFE